MPSTFLGLNTAYTGLLSANASLNTTANNISNTETEGYSRQKVTAVAAEAIRTFASYGCVGAGVDVISIDRIRDEFYDQKYWNNETKLGNYETKKYYCSILETYFADNEKVTGFNSVFNQMYFALDEVQKNPADASAKAQFISFSNSFTEYFNNMACELEDLQKEVNEELKIKVAQISSISEKMSILNQQINVIEAQGKTANELRDQRALLVDELAKIVSVETIEQPIYDQNQNPTNATTYMVKICGGLTLVDNEIGYTLHCVARDSSNKVNQSDVEGLYDIYWNDGTEFNLSNASIGGELAGLVDLRDGNNAEYFHGEVRDVYKTMYYDDKLKESVQRTALKIEVTDEKLIDFNKTRLSDNGQVKINNKYQKYDSFSFIEETNALGEKKYYYEFVLSEGEAANRTVINQTCEVGCSVDYQGIPYYMSQMNEWCRAYSQAFNKILTTDGVDAYGNQALNLFVANSTIDPTQYTFSEYESILAAYQTDINNLTVGNVATLKISNKADSYYKLTASTFNIATYMHNDSQLLATHTKNFDVNSDSAYDIVSELQRLKTDQSLMSFRGCNASEFLQCVLADVALNANSANTFSTNYTSMESLINNQRLSISGVDEDEEAANLVKFQNCYNLASKMIQVLSEVYDRLITQTGV